MSILISTCRCRSWKQRKKGIITHDLNKASSSSLRRMRAVVHALVVWQTLLLATLTALEVDPAAAESAALFKGHGGFARVVPHLFSAVPATVALACAVVQNTVADCEHARLLREAGGVERLRELARCDEVEAVALAAQACLHNLACNLAPARPPAGAQPVSRVVISLRFEK